MRFECLFVSFFGKAFGALRQELVSGKTVSPFTTIAVIIGSPLQRLFRVHVRGSRTTPGLHLTIMV
jgi:hypothetical protein